MFTVDSFIQTSRGYVRMSNLGVGEYKGCISVCPTVDVTLSNGQVLHVSENHKFSLFNIDVPVKRLLRGMPWEVQPSTTWGKPRSWMPGKYITPALAEVMYCIKEYGTITHDHVYFRKGCKRAGTRYYNKKVITFMEQWSHILYDLIYSSPKKVVEAIDLPLANALVGRCESVTVTDIQQGESRECFNIEWPTYYYAEGVRNVI